MTTISACMTRMVHSTRSPGGFGQGPGWALATHPHRQAGAQRKTIGKHGRHHPELRKLQKLRDKIAELRLGAFLNTIGADGASRCPIMPLWTRTGRNQPQRREQAFLLSLPSWTHGVIRPQQGWGIAGLDWVSQETGNCRRHCQAIRP